MRTRLCPPLTPEEAVRFSTAFLEDTLAVASAPALRADLLLAMDGGGAPEDLPDGLRAIPRIAPRGNSVGERLVSIFGETFAKGYSAVCVVGSDAAAPHLPAAFVLEAFGRLQAGADAVFGPADGGGYCLTALPRPVPALFEAIPWSGSDVLKETLTRASVAELRVALLPRWYAIDTADDLRRLKEDLRRSVAQAPVTARVMESLSF